MRSEQRVGLSSRTSDVMEEGCFFRGTKEKRIEVRGRTSNPKTAAACIHLWLRQCWNLVGIPRSLEDSLLICLVSRARFSGRENEKEKKKKRWRTKSEKCSGALLLSEPGREPSSDFTHGEVGKGIHLPRRAHV